MGRQMWMIKLVCGVLESLLSSFSGKDPLGHLHLGNLVSDSALKVVKNSLEIINLNIEAIIGIFMRTVCYRNHIINYFVVIVADFFQITESEISQCQIRSQ
ncbi:putative MATE efflux family protein [Trichinella spiralis]|uniref:putative MATE efflux family protein n=1 Tax=Trichinella spiralis TaxID=6334 RepID=UPI0001EFEFAE|nr:putative MATE efflux family protein [Trichinella spiralis]